jgi:transposase
MGNWLLSLGIRDVAMEATGVYWIPVYEALASRGLRVTLVDARSAKALPGRKSDVQDCQWIRDLHMYGMLNSCVVPEAKILVLRSYWRQRDRLVRQRSEQSQLMHKALEQMNIQLHKALSDVTGVSGMAIIRAILAGERDPKVLSALLVHRARLKKDLVEKALEGRWADHHLFALEEAVSTYDFLGSRLQMCDRRLDEAMSELGGGTPGSRRPPNASKNAPNFDLKARVRDLLGTDPTVIDGIEASTAAVLVCELGTDLSKFKTKKHLSSYLGLAPQNKITGGNIKSSKTKKVKHRAANALRLAAQSLHSSASAMGAFYRRLCARIGPAKATTACARKIAEAYYELVVNGVVFQDIGEQAYNERFREQRIRSLNKQAHKYGLRLVEEPTMAT